MQWRVGPFRLDLDNACLWRGDQRLALRPKTFDLLVYLVERAGELVTKDELLAAVWPETVVAESVLSVSISELRKALGETARQPQFIATAHRRGYRLIAMVEALDPSISLPTPPTSRHEDEPSSVPRQPLPTLAKAEDGQAAGESLPPRSQAASESRLNVDRDAAVAGMAPDAAASAPQTVPDVHWLTGAPDTQARSATLTPRHNLPPQTTSFIGRDAEVTELRRLLLEEPNCRLVTLIGAGGIGKTRLALKTAETIVEQSEGAPTFAHGLFFISLEASRNASDLVSAIVSVLARESGFAAQASAPLQRQLLDFLQSRELLLILDNFEQLAGESELLAAMLAAAPGLKLLVTSRVGLTIVEEWFFPLDGLTLPPSEMLDMTAADYDAVRLFTHHARRARRGFALEDELEHVVRLCHLLDGMPLALELAAAWLKGLTCQQMVTELEAGIDILTARHQNAPARHRSMRTVLEQSWRRLAEEDQQALSRLSVFRGGFQPEAARVTADASAGSLTQLVEQSMIRLSPQGRYQLHELLRQFAAEHLLEAEMAREAHGQYFVEFAHQHYAQFLDKGYREALQALSDDLENLRAAWQWLFELALEAPPVEERLGHMEMFIHPMTWLHRERAMHWEGKRLCQMGCDALMRALGEENQPPDLNHRMQVILARLRIRLAYFLYVLGDYEEVETTLAAALSVARASDLHEEEALALDVAARVHLRRGRFAEAKTTARRSLELAQQAGSELYATEALVLLARTAADEGDYDLAVEQHQRCVVFYRRLHYTAGAARSLANLGNTHILRGDYTAAKPLFEEALAMAQADNNRFLILHTATNLARVMSELGHYAWADAAFQSNLRLARDIGDLRRVTVNLNNLSCNDLYRHDAEAAQRHAQEALSIAHGLHCTPDVLSSITFLAHAWARQGHAHAALRALLYVAHHPTTLAWDRSFNQALLSALCDELGADAVAEAEAWRRAKYLDEVVAWVSLAPVDSSASNVVPLDRFRQTRSKRRI